MLKQRVLVGESIRQIALGIGTTKTNIQYWLRKFGLKTRRGPHGRLAEQEVHTRKCPCGETDATKFYGSKRHLCGACQNRYVLERGRNFRAALVQKHGGRCTNCGYDKYLCALDFHHLNPAEKDPAFINIRGWSQSRADAELVKCILLCRCCHAAVHTGELHLSVAQFG